MKNKINNDKINKYFCIFNHDMRIDNNLKRDIENYCILNGLNVDIFINKILKKAFLVEKYGDKPSIFNTSEKKVISYSFHCKFEKEVLRDVFTETEEKPNKIIRKRKLT